MGVTTRLTLKEYEENLRRISASTIAPKDENAGEQFARIERAKKDYRFFFEYYFPRYATSQCGWFHVFAANLLLRHSWFRGLFDWFRGCAKSVHADLGWPLWLKINDELHCMLLIGENKDKAELLLSDIQANLTANERFKHDFGEQQVYGSWAEGNFKTKDGCSFFALGIGQSPRGFRDAGMRPDYIVVDDVDSEELSNNPKRVRRLVKWVTGGLMGCFDGPRQRLIVVNNRPFVHGVIGYLIKDKICENALTDKKTEYDVPLGTIAKGIKATKAIAYQVKKGWHRLRVNAVNSIEDPEPSWPEKYTREYWQMMIDDKTYSDFMGEYQNTPITEGTIFKNEWLQWRKALPLEQYDYLICYCDPSWKGTAGSDHKGIAFIGKVGREYHLLKIFNRVASNTTMVQWMYDIYESMDPHRSRRPYRFEVNKTVSCVFYIEATLNQDLHLGEFEREGDARGCQLPIRPDLRAKGDKFSRIESLSAFYSRGWFFHNSDENDNPDMLLHIEHTKAFEHGTKTPDDSLDAEEGAIYYAQRHTKAIGHDPITGGYPDHNNKKW